MGVWFASGGFGMWLLAALGLAVLFAGTSVIAGAPSDGRLRFLRAAPGLVVGVALFAFGTNLWAVARHLATRPDDVAIAWVGFFESAQALTFGGFIVALAAGFGIFADRAARRS